MRTISTFILLFLFVPQLSAQVLSPFQKPPNTPDTLYYQFYNGVQMIEIDHAGAWEREVSWHESTQPRGMSWSSIIPPPPPNVYLFRDVSGKIIKAFNSLSSLEEQNDHFKKVPLSKGNKFPYSTRLYHRWREEQTKYSMAFLRHSVRVNSGYIVHTVLPEPLNSINRVTGNYAGLIDSLGNFVFPIIYELIEKAGRHFLVKKDGYYGIISRDCRIILPFEYDVVNTQTETAIIFSKKEKIACIYDVKKETITKMDDYDWIDTDNIDKAEGDNPVPLIKVGKNGKIGFINKKHLPVTPIQYDYADYHFKDGLLLISRNKKWGYINSKGEEVIDCRFDDAAAFNNGAASVLSGGKRACINIKGEPVNSCEHRYTGWERNSELRNEATFIKERRIVKRNYHYGITDDNNNIIVPIIYESIIGIAIYGRNTEWHPGFYKARRHGKWGVIDKDGNESLSFEYDMIDDFRNGDLIFVEKNGLHGLLDKSFNWVIPCKYEGLNPHSYEGKVWFYENKLWGLMNMDQSVIIPPKYEQTGWLKNNRIHVSRGKLCGFIDSTGKEIIPLIYENTAAEFFNGLVMAMQQKKWGFIDSLNNTVIPFQYDELRNFAKKITGAKKYGKFGFINRNNEAVTGFIYDFIGHDWYVDGLVEVRRNGKIGFADETGKEAIPCIYDDQNGFRGDMGHHMKKGNEWMYVK